MAISKLHLSLEELVALKKENEEQAALQKEHTRQLQEERREKRARKKEREEHRQARKAKGLSPDDSSTITNGRGEGGEGGDNIHINSDETSAGISSSSLTSLTKPTEEAFSLQKSLKDIGSAIGWKGMTSSVNKSNMPSFREISQLDTSSLPSSSLSSSPSPDASHTSSGGGSKEGEPLSSSSSSSHIDALRQIAKSLGVSSGRKQAVSSSLAPASSSAAAAVADELGGFGDDDDDDDFGGFGEMDDDFSDDDRLSISDDDF